MTEENTTPAESTETTQEETQETIDTSDSLMGSFDEDVEKAEQSDKQELVKPEDLPDEFWDSENGFKQDDMLKAYQQEKARADGLRRKLSKGVPDAPKSVDEYKVEIPESLSHIIKNDDAEIAAVKEFAVENGLSNDVVNGLVNHVVGKLQDSGFYDNVKSEAEQTREYEAYKDAEYKKLGDEAPKIVNNVKQFIKTQMDQELLSKGEAEALLASGTNADAINALNKLRLRITGEQNIPMQEVTEGVKSQQEIDKMIVAVDENGESLMNNPSYMAKVDSEIEKRRVAGYN